MIGIFTRIRDLSLSKILQQFTNTLAELSEEFSWAADEYDIVSFYETEAIPWLGTPVRLSFLLSFRFTSNLPEVYLSVYSSASSSHKSGLGS